MRVRSNSISSWATEMPPLTTYLPWSPASYQPPLTSRVPAQVHGSAYSFWASSVRSWQGTAVSPWFGDSPA